MALFVVDQRERMANKLLMQGSATMDEVLFASFGAWPPAGLKIIGENNQRVNFMSLWQMSNHHNAMVNKEDQESLYQKLKDSFSIAGRATLSNERIIGISKVSTVYVDRIFALLQGNVWAAISGNKDTMRTTIAHESAHILQGDHYWRANEIFGYENSQKIWTDHKDAPSNTIARDVFDSNQKKPGFLMNLFNKMAGNLGMTYYQQGIEIQARIHEVVAGGYKRWGTMPGNRAELYAALENSGLKVPERFLDEIEKSPMADDIQILFQSKKNDGSASEAANDINFTIASLTKEGQDKFWDETMPALYADLIEMYGDGPGRERFGLGENTRREMRQSDDFIAAQQHFKTTPKQTQLA